MTSSPVNKRKQRKKKIKNFNWGSDVKYLKKFMQTHFFCY